MSKLVRFGTRNVIQIISKRNILSTTLCRDVIQRRTMSSDSEEQEVSEPPSQPKSLRAKMLEDLGILELDKPIIHQRLPEDVSTELYEAEEAQIVLEETPEEVEWKQFILDKADTHSDKTFFQELAMWLLDQEPRRRLRFLKFLKEQNRISLINEIRKQFIRAKLMGANARKHYFEEEHKETVIVNMKDDGFISPDQWEHGSHILKPLWELQEKELKYTWEPALQLYAGVPEDKVDANPKTLIEWFEIAGEKMDITELKPWLDYRPVYKRNFDLNKDDKWNNEELYDLPKSITEQPNKKPVAIPQKRHRSKAFPSTAPVINHQASENNKDQPYEEYNDYRNQNDDREFLFESEFKYSVKPRLGGYPVPYTSFRKYDALLEEVLQQSAHNAKSGYAGAGYEFPTEDEEHYAKWIDDNELDPVVETKEGWDFAVKATHPPKGWWAFDNPDIWREPGEEKERMEHALDIRPEFYGVVKEYDNFIRDPNDDPLVKSKLEAGRHSFFKVEFEEYVIHTARTVNMTRKGRTESFNAMVFVGSRRGFVGLGFGESTNMQSAMKNARAAAYRDIRAVETFKGRVMNSFVEAKSGKCKVRIESLGYNSVSGNLQLEQVCDMLGLTGVHVQVTGRRSPLHLMVAFFKCIDKLRTKPWLLKVTGKRMELTDTPIRDYLDNVRANRSMFGWY